VAQKQHLKLRGSTWYVYVQIPARLRKAAGQWAYIKSLNTGDLNQAERLKHAHVAAYKRKIEALEKSGKPSDALADLYEKALAWRETMEKAKGEVLWTEPDGTPFYLTDEFLDHIKDETEDFEARHGQKAADTFYNIARGQGTPPLVTQIEPWLAEQQTIEQTKVQQRTVLRAFLAWAGKDVTISDVTRRRAGEYVSHLLSTTDMASQTARRYVSSLSSLWSWMERRGVASDNPWLRQGVGKKSKRGITQPRQQWTDDALVRVLSGPYTTRYSNILHDLVKLALVTGARLEELCALKVTDAHKRDDGWWIDIRQGKTMAAVRTVPIHDSVAHVLERRSATEHEFLFSNLVPGGPDKRRSANVSKTFTNYTRTLGLKKEERQTFHALRKTFVEVMEGADVPLSTIQLIIGHKRQSITLRVYSAGKRVQLREAINKLNYSDSVMRLIREPTKNDEAIPDTTVKKRAARARNSKKDR
jgi:integrase